MSKKILEVIGYLFFILGILNLIIANQDIIGLCQMILAMTIFIYNKND